MDMIENPNYYVVDRPYKSKYICTDCRKIFKRRILSDISTEKDLKEKEPKCPDCGNPTSWIGPKFRAPKKDNVAAWESIKIFNDLGTLKFIGFANDKVTIPETKKALNDLLVDMKNDFELTIKNWTTIDYNPENKNQIKYFSDLILKIDKYVKNK
jgi:DNA-directed RNA polymerase subunit RPC12/RpoP